MPEQDTWFQTDFRYKTGSSWGNTKPYVLQGGQWAAATAYTKGVGDTPPPAGIVEGPPVDYTVGTPITEPLLQGRKDILYFRNFDDEAVTRAWFGSRAGYGWTSDPSNVLEGGGALEITHIAGTHDPFEIYELFDSTDIAYIRFNRKWDTDHDFTRHKMPGIYAWKDRKRISGSACIKPTGLDKYSLKLSMTHNRKPQLYSYHIDQPDGCGQGFNMNLDTSFAYETGRWYTMELMIKPNTVTNGQANRDGEIGLWIDGVKKAEHGGLRYRHTTSLKICEFTYSAYVGGSWVSPKNQKLWDDQICLATGRVDQHL